METFKHIITYVNGQFATQVDKFDKSENKVTQISIIVLYFMTMFVGNITTNMIGLGIPILYFFKILPNLDMQTEKSQKKILVLVKYYTLYGLLVLIESFVLPLLIDAIYYPFRLYIFYNLIANNFIMTNMLYNTMSSYNIAPYSQILLDKLTPVFEYLSIQDIVI